MADILVMTVQRRSGYLSTDLAGSPPGMEEVREAVTEQDSAIHPGVHHVTILTSSQRPALPSATVSAKLTQAGLKV